MQVIKIEVGHIEKVNFKHNLCLGFFDGVHLGHQSLINEAKKYQESISILTFDKSFKGGKCLTTLEDKIELFSCFGIEHLFVLKMDEELIRLAPIDFINNVLKVLNPSHLICGLDYTFGYKGLGSPTILKEYFPVDVVNLLPYKKEEISSTLIKEMIKDGRLNEANQLLGHNYTIKGPCIRGLHNGTKHLYPTINVSLENYIVPCFGVYIVNLHLNNGEIKKAIANVGLHPTIDALNVPILEIYIKEILKEDQLHFLKVEFLEFVRKERKFNSLEELKAQITHDIGLI